MRILSLLIAIVLSPFNVFAEATFDAEGNQIFVIGGVNTLESIASDIGDSNLFSYDESSGIAEFSGHYLTFGSADVITEFIMEPGQTLLFTNGTVNNRRIIMNSGVHWSLDDCAISGFVQIDMNSGDQSGKWINVNWIRTNETSNSQFSPFRIRTNHETFADDDPLVWRGGSIDTGASFNTFIPDPASGAFPNEPGFRRLEMEGVEIITRLSNTSVINYYQDLGNDDREEVQFNFTDCQFTILNFDSGTGFYIQSQILASPAIFNLTNIVWQRDGEDIAEGQVVQDETAESRGLAMLQLRAVNDIDSQINLWRYLDVITVANDGISPVNDIEVAAESMLADELDLFFNPIDPLNSPQITTFIEGLGNGHTPLPPDSFLILDYSVEPDGTGSGSGIGVQIVTTLTAEPDGFVEGVAPDFSWYRPDPMVPGKNDSITITVDVEPPTNVENWEVY